MVDQQAQQAAFVLHFRPYRETSLLVDLFTLNEGRISVVARGARRPGSQLRHTLQPFTLLSVRYRGQQELKTLLSAETAQAVQMLNGKSLLCGLYVNELLERLLHTAAAFPELFVYYQYLLNELRTGVDLEAGLRVFEHQLLKELGVWKELSHLEASSYVYLAGEGLTVSRIDTANAITTEQLREIEQDQYTDPQVRRAAKMLMRAMLNELLGDRPLRSRSLFEKRRKSTNIRESESQ